MRRYEKASGKNVCSIVVEVFGADTDDEFRAAVSSRGVVSTVCQNLMALYGASAPQIEFTAADVRKRVVHVGVSGGADGLQMLRAACAATHHLLPPSSEKGPARLPQDPLPIARLTVVRVKRTR